MFLQQTAQQFSQKLQQMRETHDKLRTGSKESKGAQLADVTK